MHDEFVARLDAKMSELVVGDPSDEDTQIGPLINASSVRRVEALVDDAKAHGASAKRHVPGDERLVAPTLLTEVDLSMRIAAEETFGPVATILRVPSVDEAIAVANDSPFALNAAAFTQDLRTAYRFVDGLHHGTVLINETTNYWDQMVLFGGAKQRGVGREMSTSMLRALTPCVQ